jgi:hypothetical protein
MDQSIKAGILGIVLAVFVNLSILVPAPFDFLPTFVIAIFAIYVFRLTTFKDGLIATFMTYIFNEGIINTLILADYYTSNRPYTLTITTYLIPDPIITATSAIIAAYIGTWLAKKRTPPPPKQPQQTTDIPPELQTV